MGGREGYTVVAQGPGAAPRLPRRTVALLALAGVLATAVAAVAVTVWRPGHAKEASGEASPGGSDAELWEAPPWLEQACQGAAGFLHLSLCTTSTMTSTTTTRTQTRTTSTTTVTSTTATSTSTSTATRTTTRSTTTETETMTSTSTLTTTSSTATSTTVTTTPWLGAMRWVGCFARDEDAAQLAYQNTLPRPYGYTSAACARACRSYRYVLLKENGLCACTAVQPKTPDFKEVAAEKCGPVCSTEEELKPARRCGSETAFAIFRIDSAAEVFEEISSGSADGGAQDIWPSWAQERRGAAPKGAHEAKKRAKEVLMGVSYGPVPLRSVGQVPDDDFMSEMTEALWGARGRRDLSIIKSLGANTVRLYGNDPALDHTAFLDEAMRQGLQVIAGVSDYPYTQMPGNCVSTGFDCYEQVRRQYTENLKRGFLMVGNVYHPALRTVILMNEPDLKFPGGPRSYCKALISAFDAALDAEKAMGVAGQAPAFTATFSFGVCPACSQFGYLPAVGQMMELRKAMMHPESVGYHTRNDIWAAYQARFINSANTANPATDIRRMFLDTYDQNFQGVPVFIGEYHSPRTLDQKRDLEIILDIAANESTMLQGISFFEFQVRYDKGGSEESFGMFGLEERSVTDMQIGNGAYQAYCLKPLEVAAVTAHMYQNQCGPIEVGVDYISESTWAMSMDHIPTPEFCCQQCEVNPKCRSWTWVEDAHLVDPGSPSQCWLKGGLPTGKAPKDGVISGVPASVRRTVVPLDRKLLRGAGAQPLDNALAPPSGVAPPEEHVPQMRWAQCGGKFWGGATTCVGDWRCKVRSEFYSQCMPPPDAAEAYPVPGSPEDKLPNIFVHMAVTAAFGGPGVTADQLCPVKTTTVTTTPPPVTTTEIVVVAEVHHQGGGGAAAAASAHRPAAGAPRAGGALGGEEEDASEAALFPPFKHRQA